MLLNLIKIRLKALHSMFFRRRLAKKAASPVKKILIALFAVYIIAALFISMGSLMYGIVRPVTAAGLDWLYFAIAGIFASIVSLMGSVFSVQKELFDAKDNELLLSMPIRYPHILASRVIVLLALELLYIIMIMLPAGLVYAVYGGGITVIGAISFIIGSVLLMLFVLAAGTIVGWIASLITSRLRAKTLFTTLFMLGFIVLYVWFYSNLNKYLARLVSEGATIAEAVRRAIPPAYNFGRAITAGGYEGLRNLAILALWCLIPFAAVYFILSRTFLELAASGKPVANIEYRKRELKVSGAYSALVRKELRRFFTLPIYLINCGLGAIMMLVLAGAVIVQSDKIITMLTIIPNGRQLLAPVLCAMLCFCAVTSNTAAPSLSLEGKSLWILKANPINPADIYRAKIAANIIICIPCILVSAAVMSIMLPMNAIEIALVFIFPSVYMFFTAVYGMAMNIMFPSFDWINETVVIKQSGSVIAAALGGMAILTIPVILFIPAVIIMPAELYIILCTVVFAASAAGLYGWTITRGVSRFAEM